MEQIRSFVAIELPHEIKAELASLENRLKEGRHSFVKWVAPDSIHLTLKFLGNIASVRIPQIVESLARAAQGISPLNLQLGGLGAFPNLHRPRVIWVGIEGDVAKLALLHRSVDSALSALGFASESRAFTPHLTLGRLREKISLGESQGFGKWASSIERESGNSFQARSFALIKSRLTPEGSVYSRQASIELKR